jgi:putative nucleotidyltransferase with HDIG domain
MIKRISVDQLRLGMFVHDLNCSWIDHPFLLSRFKVDQLEELQKIRATGVRELYIDTALGLDSPEAPSAAEIHKELEKSMHEVVLLPMKPARIPQEEERGRAREVLARAHRTVRQVMTDVRLGRAVEVDQVEDVVEAITTSILRNDGALLSLCQIKDKDEYTFLHSVSVCTLLVAFCRSLGLPPETIRIAGIGGLLHDVGKMQVPNEILNKPGRLTSEEFEVIKRHPGDGFDLLSGVPGLAPEVLDITRHHHERMDGTGYPDALPGEQIAQLAQMAAIVDVYDALSAERCYHKAMPPSEALRKIYEWSRFHFNPDFVGAFLQCVGIYPTGSLVKLESGRLAVVLEQTPDDILKPQVRAFFSTRSNTYIPPVRVDLSKGSDNVVSYESPSRWNVDSARFMV